MSKQRLFALPATAILVFAAQAAWAQTPTDKAAAAKASKPATTATTATTKATTEKAATRELTPAAAQSTPAEDRRMKSGCHDKSADA